MRRVRRANIAQRSRDLFERFGEDIIAQMVAASFTPRVRDLQDMYNDDAMLRHAAMWLTERGDEKVLHEQRVEFVEWAILLFVVAGVILDIILVCRGGK